MTVGEKIRNERRVRGWTLEEMHHRTGFSIAYLSDIQCGRTNPSLKALDRIAYAFGLDAYHLLIGVHYAGRKPDGTQTD